MSDEYEPNETDDRLEELFRQLPRELPYKSGVDARAVDGVIAALKSEGFLATRRRWPAVLAQLAAAIVLVILGGTGWGAHRDAQLAGIASRAHGPVPVRAHPADATGRIRLRPRGQRVRWRRGAHRFDRRSKSRVACCSVPRRRWRAAISTAACRHVWPQR